MLIAQLAIGSVVIGLSVLVQAGFIGAAEARITNVRRWFLHGKQNLKLALALAGVTLWMMAAHSISVWIWAIAFRLLGVFDTIEPAVYFSVVAFTTLGFGDVLLPEDWRLLAGLSAANGLLIFGLSTAFMVEFLRQVRRGPPPE